MPDVNANIGVHIDTSAALAELKNLQRQLATFHQSIAKGSAASALAQKNLQTNLLNAINATGQFTAQMGLVRTSTESFTHALEKNKLGMREYFRYAGGATKTFGRLFKSEFDTIQKVAEERVRKMQTQYIKMGRDANGAMKAMAIAPTTLNMKDYATQTAIAAQKQALFNQLIRQGSTNLLNFGKNTQWAGRQLMVGFTVPLAYLGTAASKTFIELEKQALKFRRVYGDMFTTTEDTNKALEEIQRLAEGFTKYGVAVADTMEMAAAAAAMGKTGADLTAQVAEATRLAVLGGVEQQQALDTTISLTNAFGLAAEDLAKKVNFLNSVENQTVVSIEDLTIAIPKAGPVVKQLGGDVEDLAFFLTAMKEGGINASEGANALKSGLASLINPTKKAAQMLNDMGVNINAIVEGNAGNVRQTVIDFARALDTLDPLNRARAIEQLFGKFQFSRLSTLFQNVTKDGTQAAKVLGLAGASIEELAILSERELKAVEDSVGTNFKAAVEDLKLTLAPIGKEFLKTITPVIKVIGNILEKFNGLSDGTKKFIVVATALVGIIGPTFLMTFGLLANGAANIIKLFLALRMGFLKLGGNSKLLAEQTNYMTMEQLEATTVASSLNQAHARLTQSFTVEASAVRALRQAYIDATAAAAKFAAANPGMMAPSSRGPRPSRNNLGQTPRRFADGATYVPGMGNEDTVPAVLTPGEAVIPKKVAQDPRFQPIINAMVAGRLQAFDGGTDDAQPVKRPFANSPEFQSKIDLTGPSSQVLQTNPTQVMNLLQGKPGVSFESNEAFAARSAALLAKMQEKKKSKRGSGPTQKTHVGQGKEVSIAEILKSDNLSADNRLKLQVFDEILRVNGESRTTLAYHDLMYDFNKDFNRSMQREPGVDSIQFLEEWKKLGPSKWAASGISQYDARKIDDLMYEIIKRETTIDPDNPTKKPLRTTVTDNYVAEIFAKRIPKEHPEIAESTTYKKMNALYQNLGAFRLGKGLKGTVAETEAVLKRALDAGVIKDFRVSPTKKNEVDSKGRLITGSIYVTDNDGNIISLNRGGAGTRVTTPVDDLNRKIAEIENEANRKGAKSFVDRENALEEVAAKTKKSPVSDQDPEKYTRQIARSSGYSFTPEPGIAGFYEKSDGSKVFVKPVMDYDAAIAEQRGTIIARDVHGLDAPLQTIKTMIDPSDAKGQRKLIVLESPYEPRFDPANMSNQFTEDDYFRQLVAATLRADSDVKKGNLSGNILADVGAAGVFETASGDRGYSANIRSMQEQAEILLGNKGTKFFREATADIPKNMTPEEYQRRVVAEIDRVLPRLQSTIDGFDLNPQERKVYDAMIARLKAGRNVDWKQFHALHSKVLVAKDESFQDKKTGEITKIRGKSKPSGVVPSSGKLADNKITEIPEGKKVVKTPKTRRVGKTILPGLDNAPQATGVPLDDIEKQFRREQNSLRRKAEKIQRDELRQKKLALRSETRQSEIRENLRKTENDNIKSTIDAKKAEDARNAKMQQQQSRMMKMQGVGMAAGMAASGAYMTGNANVGNALMGLSVLATIGPMLKSPTAIIVSALVAGGAMLWKFNNDIEKARKAGSELGKSMVMTSEKLQKLSVLTGTVSATELANKKRTDILSGEGAVQRKFGQNILSSEFGKGLLSDIEKQAESGQSVRQIASTLSNNLSYAVVQGVVTPEQARSIAAALGEELKSYEIPALVSGELVNLLGPNGENLTKDPLSITLEIQKRSMDKQLEVFQNAQNNRKDTSDFRNNILQLGGAAAAIAALTATGIGAPVALAASVIMLGKAAMDANKVKSENTKLDAAATQMGIEQIAMNNNLVDSLNKQYDLKLKTAKTQAEIDEIEKNRTLALDELNTKNADALDLFIAQKKELSSGAFDKGIKAAVDALYKEGPLKAFADQAMSSLSQMKDSRFKAMLQVELASGGLDPITVMKLVKNPKLESRYNVMVEAIGTKDTNLILQLLMKAGVEDQNIPLFLDIINKDPDNFDKNMNAIAVLANMKQKYGITIDLNDDGTDQVDKIIQITDKLNGMPEELTRETFFNLGITGDLTQEEMDLLWTTLVGTAKTVNQKVVIDFVAAGDRNVVDQYISAKGIKIPLALSPQARQSRKDELAPQAQAWLVGRQGKVEEDRKNGLGQDPVEENKKRDTTFDDILNTLKRTRDATIDVTKGAQEMLRILGGKKDITIFNGIDQQLSKIKANSDFIDWVGGIDDAIRNKLITVTKKGVVALTELGDAAKKAFDEKQLGLFSAGAQDQINTAKAQRIAFLKLSNAGLATSDVLKIIEDGNLANAIANAKNSGEIKKVVEEEKARKKQMELTSAMTDPQTFLSEINAELDKQYSYQKKIMELEKSKTEARISGDYIGAAILGQEQSFETSSFSRNIVDLTGKMGTIQNAMGLLGGIKDKAQRAQLQSTLGQGMLGLQQLGSFNPTYGYTPQFAGINPTGAFGGKPTSTTDSSGSVYNIQMTVNGNNATADDIANQVIKKINLVAQRNNKTNAVGK